MTDSISPDGLDASVPASAPSPTPASRWEDFLDMLYAPSDVYARRANSGFGIPLLVVTLAIGLLGLAMSGAMSPIMDAEFHRGAAKGPETELAAWGKKPWTTDAPAQVIQFHRTDTRQALTGIGANETPARAPHSIGLGSAKPVVLK